MPAYMGTLQVRAMYFLVQVMHHLVTFDGSDGYRRAASPLIVRRRVSSAKPRSTRSFQMA